MNRLRIISGIGLETCTTSPDHFVGKDKLCQPAPIHQRLKKPFNSIVKASHKRAVTVSVTF